MSIVAKVTYFRSLCFVGTASIVLGLASGQVTAHPEGAVHEHHEDLSAEATNPVAPLMSMRLQYQNSPSNYNASGYSQAGIFQGVVPIPLPSKAVPILIKHFSGGWYVSAPDLPQTYDFKTNEWSTNIGAVVGRVFPWRKQHLQLFGGVYYNSEDNKDIIAGEWTMKFNVSFLLPE